MPIRLGSAPSRRRSKVGAARASITGRFARRFGNRDRFAAYNGTPPIEVSSAGRVVHRLSRRGNRTLNYAIHMAAVGQIRHPHSEGRAFYDRKVSENRPTGRPSEPSSGGSVTPSTANSSSTPTA